MSYNNNEIQKLRSLIDNMEKDLKVARRLLMEVEEMTKKNYKEIPGVEGMFDGYHLVAESGEKYEVPANYAAKSRLVFGDTIKMVEEEGKKLFKQINKVPRKSVEGVMNKKEGKWYFLSEIGSYRVNDSAVDFNKLQLNDKVTALVPENNLNAPFATLDKVPSRGRGEPTGETQEKKAEIHEEQASVPSEKKPVRENLPKKEPIAPKKPVATKPHKPVSRETAKPSDKSSDKPDRQEFVKQIQIGEDDLR